jgi:UDP-N-acetylmuramoyl-L-alanyl-D-glutamate--2,6-diaminopimelate ligase
VAIFTNLTVDHLDYHHTMENYCKVKNQLFSSLHQEKGKNKKPYVKTAVVNIDSAWHAKILEGFKAELLTYAIDQPAMLRATDIEMKGSGTRFKLSYQGQSIICNSPLIGRYNVYNLLAAIGVLLTKKIPLEQIVERAALFTAVSGRLEPVPNALGLKIYVDFAHSDDALTNVLECLQEIKDKGKIITVFGCGGDRDQTKRPRMARATEALSDICIVTSDNPRSEDPAEIAKQVVAGFKNKEKHLVVLDRKQAIEMAIDMATPDDIILIAGKGHEPYQIFAHKIVEFDDRKVAAQICQSKWKNK